MKSNKTIYIHQNMDIKEEKKMAESQLDREKIAAEALRLSKQFEELDGRRPRMFLPEMEEDDDKESRKLAATAFADQGWDVDVGPLLSPEVSAQTAADNDVHFIFYTSKSPTMAKVVIKMSQTLALLGRDDILVAVHPVKKEDKETFFRYGVVAAFDEKTAFEDMSLTMLRVLVAMAKEESDPTPAYDY